jgi:hypothetical protein
MKLNEDIIAHILSFLPIVDKNVAQVNKSILNLKTNINDLLLTYYYNIYNGDDIYLSWLLNDIERWMNQDIATMNGYTDKYIEIVKKTTNQNTEEPIVYTSYWDNLYSNPKTEIKKFTARLSLIEVIDLYKFIIKIHPFNNMFAGTGEQYISTFYSQSISPLIYRL